MTNGNCHVGSENAANIKSNRYRIERIETKVDWILYLVIVNLVAIIINWIV